jgi:hypothetical protein
LVNAATAWRAKDNSILLELRLRYRAHIEVLSEVSRMAMLCSMVSYHFAQVRLQVAGLATPIPTATMAAQQAEVAEVEEVVLSLMARHRQLMAKMRV